MSKKLVLNYMLKNAGITDINKYHRDPTQLGEVIRYVESLKDRSYGRGPYEVNMVKKQLEMLVDSVKQVIRAYSHDHGTSAESDKKTLTPYEITLITGGNPLVAIRVVKERLNMGLAEAKSFVENQSLSILGFLPFEISRALRAHTVPLMNYVIADICERTGESEEVVFSRLADFSKKYHLNLNLT